MNTCITVDLGLIGYAEACQLQKQLVVARKSHAIENVLLLCEHPHVLTLGRNGKHEHLLASELVLRQKGVQFHATDRGGDITYHGPGQLVAYPILDLTAIRKDVGWYVRMLEEVMIRATAAFGIVASRVPGKTGIWVAATHVSEEKLGAIGVHLSRWVTSHGFAYNVSTDLRYFDLIVPCGIAGRKATSLEKILERAVARAEALAPIVDNFGEVLGVEMRAVTYPELLAQLRDTESSSAETSLESGPAVTASLS
jgi:lipoyl(octanoyl) transferase